ncbi:MAG: hypothetical protein LBU96_10560 [Yokenella regensburgei]|jgi:phosphopantetheinyl transferase|uniref:Holo-(Acyl carrier protein) synthase 2 n=1 Tax=Yokenella regensburgei TaxID=158877 RepID=A0AB38FZM2_9ENTR|nr:hypothetical protein [Yokenella regensburgei]EHM50172.1 hypothetical protein HMPREF0880_01372 [Yokenella regensburgei ATCC 43003]KFD24414.1 hypothetical protein GYRE_00990 [Yokenella regensburgei ATCC 49455]MDQ4429787.1 hypothetical protein [Yokenella regensburgei]MDR2217801.1 hypothetical protein [Yokenella regensburgei]MDR3104881.1 hypothetical protein [Yokenella regensburgei]
MATHFARGILSDSHPLSVRLPAAIHHAARQLPEHRRTRYLASRALLAELMFMLYGISELPEIRSQANGKPAFSDPELPRFSMAYTGNIVGVALTTEGDCGLDMELQHSLGSVHSLHPPEHYRFSSNENLWINNQNDPHEARVQLVALRQSVLKMAGYFEQDSPGLLQLLPGSGRLRVANVMQAEAICDAEDVLVWSVAASPAIEKLRLWEYDGKNGWSSLPDIQSRAKEPAARLMRFTSLPAEKALILN